MAVIDRDVKMIMNLNATISKSVCCTPVHLNMYVGRNYSFHVQNSSVSDLNAFANSADPDQNIL